MGHLKDIKISVNLNIWLFAILLQLMSKIESTNSWKKYYNFIHHWIKKVPDMLCLQCSALLLDAHTVTDFKGQPLLLGLSVCAFHFATQGLYLSEISKELSLRLV